MQKTAIEYLTHTLNPVAMRCNRCSDGCRNCWHLKMADRLCNNPALPEEERMALAGRGPFIIRDRELSAPLHARKPAVIGVQFMGDLFHETVPIDFQSAVYRIMAVAYQHTFLILTKRPHIMLDRLSMNPERLDKGNVYHGLTICTQQEADEKIPIFLQVPGKKFLSLEPLLGPVDVDPYFHALHTDPADCPNITSKQDWCGCTQINVVLLGGETGPGARPMHPDWAISIVQQCRAAGAPVFVKQIHINGKVSKDMSEWPEELRVRELPWLPENHSCS